MVALTPQHSKTVIKHATGSNRIANYADDAAHPVTNRISQYLNPVVEETAVASRAKANGIVGQAVAKTEPAKGVGYYMDRTVGAAGTAMEYAMWAPMLVGGAQLGYNGVKWTGNKVGRLTGLKDAAEVVENVAPPKKWNSYTFSEIGEATGTRGVVGGSMQWLADRVSSPVSYIAEKTGLSGWRASANATKAANHFNIARDLAASLPAEDLTALGGLSSALTSAPNVQGFAGAASTKEMLSVAKEAVEASGSTISKEGAKLLASAEDAVMHSQGSAMWSNLKGSVSELPKKMGEGSATHGMMNAAFIGMSALSMYGDARTFSENMASLRQMYADVTGKDPKDVSTLTLMTGKVPDTVASARSHMMKTFGIKQVLDVANIAANVAMVVSPKGGGWKGIGAMIATQMASSAVDGVMGESILPIHKAFSDAYKAGKNVPAEFYASYLYAASKELRTRGDKGQQFAMEVGKQYAEERASPAQLLQEIENGKLLERVKAISHKADEAIKDATVAKVNAIAHDVADKPMPRAERPVVGKFTGKLNQEAQMAGAMQHGLSS